MSDQRPESEKAFGQELRHQDDSVPPAGGGDVCDRQSSKLILSGSVAASTGGGSLPGVSVSSAPMDGSSVRPVLIVDGDETADEPTAGRHG